MPYNIEEPYKYDLKYNRTLNTALVWCWWEETVHFMLRYDCVSKLYFKVMYHHEV